MSPGGSTEEAQLAIGNEVASNLVKFVNAGSSLSAVNFPEVDLRALSGRTRSVRILNVHRNVPGVLKARMIVTVHNANDM